MTRTHTGILIAVALAMLAPLAIGAQQTLNIPRIGILRPGSPPDPFVEAFKQGLQELGYTEGRNISFDYRWAEGRAERLPTLAADLVRLKVDVIIAGGGGPVEAASHATATIPIVMPVSGDPVKLGLAASLARPGGNVTGLATLTTELPGKWMELLKEIRPGVSRVAVLSDTQSTTAQLSVSEAVARSLGLRLQVLNVSGPDELEAAFAQARKNRAEALIVLSSPLFFAHRAEIVAFAAKQRLPTIYHHEEFVVGSGGLMSYAPNFREQFRRAAGYVDKILKGAKPGDLPIERPTKFELVINLRTAKALGLTIPQSVLSRADQVIR
jgi:putative tryptophan/tyrosine transport system substrate-binding protein